MTQPLRRIFYVRFEDVIDAIKAADLLDLGWSAHNETNVEPADDDAEFETWQFTLYVVAPVADDDDDEPDERAPADVVPLPTNGSGE